MSRVWQNYGDMFRLVDEGSPSQELPKGIYTIGFSRDFGWYEKPLGETFQFPYKIYGIEQSFIDRVLKSYRETSGNFGVLLNGVRGTGKTVTAELIANALELPILLVTEKFEPNLAKHLVEIRQPIVVFIDEYEKIYGQYGNELLSLMDGVLNTPYRKVFLLTTNSAEVNVNLLSRPTRIRYRKEFRDMEASVVEEIVDDLLEYPQWRSQVIEFISTAALITIDIVKAVISEVNIHNEPPSVFADIFNVAKGSQLYTIKYRSADLTTDDTWKTLRIGAAIGLRMPFNSDYLEEHFYLDNHVVIGRIEEIVAPDIVRISSLIAVDKLKFLDRQDPLRGLVQNTHGYFIKAEAEATTHYSFRRLDF